MEPSERTPLIVNTNISTYSIDNGEQPKTPTSPGMGGFSFKKTTKRDKIFLLSMSFVNFCAAACFSLLAPFFPKEAGIKGASPTIVGFIFGTFELVIVISSPIFGNFISEIGCKFMYVSGIMVCGVCAILFGLLDRSPNGTIFIVMCFLCRSIEALGTSAFVTALFAILAHEFPDNVITVMGFLETFSGLGMMVGPPLGGALYELGGYGLPFWVMGTVVITCGLITARMMPNIRDSKKMYSGSILTLFKSPLVIITFINIVAGSVSLGFMDPTLADHLSQFKLKIWVIGILFLIAPGVYAFTAPIFGFLGDRKGYIRLMIGGGSLGSVVAFLLLGPAPFLSFIPSKLYINIIALALIGLFVGCSLIPTFKGLLLGAFSLGMHDDINTHGKVSGLFNSSFSLGAFLGPTIGGSLVEQFGFGWACVGVCAVFGVCGTIMLVYASLTELPKGPPEQTDPVIEEQQTTKSLPPPGDVKV